ncbi:MAG: thioredoxin-like domain-containing protein, partial [Bacteroidota bacterium]
IIGDFNNFDFGSAKPMTKLENGTYQAEFETKAEKFKYQIWQAEATQRSVNGTQSEAFEYDNGGDYQSVVTPKDGKATIVFDPKRLVRNESKPQVRFTDGDKRRQGLAILFGEMTHRGQLFTQAIAAYRASGKDMKDFKYDWSKEVSSLASSIRTEKDPLLRQMLLICYLQLNQMGAKLETEYGKMALNEIPPDSPLWPLNPFAISIAAKLSGEPGKFDEYFSAVIEKQPEKEWLANVVFNEVMSAKFRNDKENLKKYYNILMERFGDTPMAKMAKERISLESNIEVGKTVPKFSFVSLDDPKTTFSETSFRGKTLLIDFWAVWCGPCIAEMENLHKAYERFKPQNFEILSLSFDPKVDDVAKFRKDKWKMPWSHVFVEKGFENETSKQFEVIGIPRPILVDGNTGKILAMEGDLRGENLEKTLKKFLDTK